MTENINDVVIPDGASINHKLGEKVRDLQQKIIDVILKEYPIGVRIKAKLLSTEKERIWVSKGVGADPTFLIVRLEEGPASDERSLCPWYTEHEILV